MYFREIIKNEESEAIYIETIIKTCESESNNKTEESETIIKIEDSETINTETITKTEERERTIVEMIN